ncbi:MAG: hypothetical protein ACI9JZ_002415 [Lentimonas sp.]|jgi:hypothetical protein
MNFSEIPPELLKSLIVFIDQVLLNPWILIALMLAATPLIKACRKR